ncbi:MAG: hypothetical protein M3446_06380 [Actinomycetota bacterium]|nr:hypothetical protein [Actinomycetota bacterium]
MTRRARPRVRHPAVRPADGFAGTAAEGLDRIGEFTELGATRFYLQVLDLAHIDHIALVAEEIAPHLTRS